MTHTDPPPRRGPVLIETGAALAEPAPHPADAPPLADSAAMAQALPLAARPMGGFGRLVWGAVAGLVGLAIATATWDFILGLLGRNVVLGWTAAVLGAIAVAGLVAFLVRETLALRRLGRVDTLRQGVETARSRSEAEAAVAAIARFYGARSDLAWARSRMADQGAGVLDADALLSLAEREYLAALDARAIAAIERAARQVAVTTALLPMALVDVAAALAGNVRMIRAVAEIYGGRSGILGSWRLLRAVAAHLVATGAVAMGDDMVGAALGGGIVARLSRRFGEGVINAALTARVGVAAIEVCRPMPFRALPRPGVTAMVRRALTGFLAPPG